MGVVWATDIHLDFVEPAAVAALGARMAATGAPAALITGDLSTAPRLEEHLLALQRAFGRPLYFVLGNHDYYGGSIRTVRERIRSLCGRVRGLCWLGGADPVDLGSFGLVGVDGWGDGWLGDPLGTEVYLNDFVQIRELCGLDRPALLSVLRGLGEAEAAQLAPRLAEALARFSRVVVATHLPPFAAACWHEGRISDEDWLPWFTCDAVGRLLRDAAAAHPQREILVLCGHTHGAGRVRISPNLEVWTGGADYGAPAIQGRIGAGAGWPWRGTAGAR